jgi:hypothetical protein
MLTGLPEDTKAVISALGRECSNKQVGITDGSIDVALNQFYSKHDEDTMAPSVVAKIKIGDSDKAVGFDLLVLDQWVEDNGEHG